MPEGRAMTSPPGAPGSGGSCNSSTSSSLLARLKAHDADAWDRLVTLYAPLVIHWCRQSDLQDQDAADVLQEVLQAMATHIDGFRRDKKGHTFRGWLRTITRNKVRDHFRRLKREPEGPGGTEAQLRLAQLPGPPAPDDETAAQAGPNRELFHRALALIRGEFEDRTWQAFWRTAVEGQPARDVAADLAMTPGAVRVAKCRVLQRLRAELGDL
jgi:RNA polymerase sigma-70 factor (ECF subfamily)